MKIRMILFYLTVLSVSFCDASHAQVVMIANLSVKATTVTSSELREIFEGNTSALPNGSRVTPVLLKQGPVNEVFLALYIGKSETAFRANWRSLLFSGEGVLPRTLDSEAAVVEYVAHTPGAVGYIGRTTPHEGVKVLTVK